MAWIYPHLLAMLRNDVVYQEWNQDRAQMFLDWRKAAIPDSDGIIYNADEGALILMDDEQLTRKRDETGSAYRNRVQWMMIRINLLAISSCFRPLHALRTFDWQNESPLSSTLSMHCEFTRQIHRVTLNQLIRGTYRPCECLTLAHKRPELSVDIHRHLQNHPNYEIESKARHIMTGRTFGEWTIDYHDRIDTKGRSRWRATCSCGYRASVRLENILDGKSKKCADHNTNLLKPLFDLIAIPEAIPDDLD